MKLGGVTVGTHNYQYRNIQVARGNSCFHEIIRIINLCDWPERSPKVKSVMAQYLKIHFIRYTNYVQSFMLLSKCTIFCYAAPLLRPAVERELERMQSEGIIIPVEFSEWATPLVCVPKPDGTVRLCGDYRTTVNPSDTHRTVSNTNGGGDTESVGRWEKVFQDRSEVRISANVT